jgi:hypothetical protein
VDRLEETYVRLQLAAQHPPTTVDRLLLRVARHGWFAVTIADAYGRLVAPHGLLRRKLVLVLAILESSKTSHADYEAANAASGPETWLRLVVIGVRWFLTTLLACALLGPLHLLVAALPGDTAHG